MKQLDRNLTRREFVKGSSALLSATALTPLTSKIQAPYLKSGKFAKKIIVLGMDGVDPGLVNRFVAEGQLPNFKRLIDKGYFGPLGTTLPPQSPVAWSSFITGTNPGGNGIYDFIHRDPTTFTPYLSTSRSFPSTKNLKIGEWNVPLTSGRVESMRRGPAFYTVLEKHGIDSTLYQIPANFPVTTKETKSVSGMGTPDLLGSYGVFTLFSEIPMAGSEHWSGGRLVRIFPFNHAVTTSLVGPANPFKNSQDESKIDVKIYRDPSEEILRIKIQSHDLILKKGEWSDWLPLSFSLIPMFASLAGMVRFYVKDVHPHIKIYCTPINIDPMEPSMPICSPASFSKEISQAVGRFYTQGLPADTKGLSHGALTDEEYFEQAKIVMNESLRSFEYQIERFKEGFFFFYFSSTDQNTHMMWRLMDPSHPLYKPDAPEHVKDGVRYFYRQMDEVIRQTLSHIDSDTLLLILSDHGFAPFKREFHLSTWLVQNGFTVLKDPTRKDPGDFYDNVDWSKTKAYALGINGIYLNIKGREIKGSLDPSEGASVKAAIKALLPNIKDPDNGESVISRLYDAEEAYSGPFVGLAPDLVVGYARGYRISDEAVLGKFPSGDLVCTRQDPWAADHCMDPAVVPGILISNREWTKKDPGIWDMAPTILNAFGLPIPSEMDGRDIFS